MRAQIIENKETNTVLEQGKLYVETNEGNTIFLCADDMRMVVIHSNDYQEGYIFEKGVVVDVKVWCGTLQLTQD